MTQPRPIDTPKNLSSLALFIAHHVQAAMQAFYLTDWVDTCFHQLSPKLQEQLYVTNPANTLTYCSLTALQSQSIVHVCEILTDEHKLYPHEAKIRRLDDLRLHRHAISHPATVKWRGANSQEFFDAGRHDYDYCAGLLWDLQRSINEELRRHGIETRNESIVVTREMAAQLHLMIEVSRRLEFPAPTVSEQLQTLQEKVAEYQAQLEKYPDGGRDPEREKARADRWERMKERWAKERKEAESTELPK